MYFKKNVAFPRDFFVQPAINREALWTRETFHETFVGGGGEGGDAECFRSSILVFLFDPNEQFLRYI